MDAQLLFIGHTDSIGKTKTGPRLKPKKSTKMPEEVEVKKTKRKKWWKNLFGWRTKEKEE